jgi:regulator of RNase E activity RraA
VTPPTSPEAGAAFARLSTPALADACLRLSVAIRVAPTGVVPLVPGMRAAGRARPARHVGSVDVFLEACRGAEEADVLVIDNGGRLDEGCIGDLTALEASASGFSGIVLWGAHRDTAELRSVGLPVWSYGVHPCGPRRLDPRPADALTRARFGEEAVGGDDFVFADDDGVLFVAASRVAEVLAAASGIVATEKEQARRVREGRTLSEQFRFEEFLRRRQMHPAWTFREHLREIGGAMEE